MRSQNNKNPEYMTKSELDMCYLPENWAKLDTAERLAILQETENRFAAQMFRPAKPIVARNFNDSTLGVWQSSDNTIYVNSSLLTQGIINSGIGPVIRPDASFLLFNTVAHEGYHAYQSYALENPRLHDNEKQLEQWRLNSEIGFTDHGFERNYITPEKSSNLYRIQPLERDAICFADRVTRETFDPIQAQAGVIPEYEYDYKDLAEACSYEKALKNQMRNDPQCVEHMMKAMEENHLLWNNEQQAAISDLHMQSPGYGNGSSYSVMTYEQAKALDDPYINDEGHYEHAIVKSLSGSNTVYVPSLADQYAERIAQINEDHPYRNNGEEEKSRYMEEIYRTQEELGYFPQFDERMAKSYEEFMAQYDEQYVAQAENGSEDVKALIAGGREKADSYFKESTGYFPNRPEDHAQEQAAELDVPAHDNSEDASLEIENEPAQDIKQNSVENLDSTASEDISEAQSEDSGFDMSAYAGITDDCTSQESSGESEDTGEKSGAEISY